MRRLKRSFKADFKRFAYHFLTYLYHFQMVNAASDIQESTVVEVVITAQPLGEDDIEIRFEEGPLSFMLPLFNHTILPLNSRPHQLSIHSYKTPTFCHFCGEMLFGMFKQVMTIFHSG